MSRYNQFPYFCGWIPLKEGIGGGERRPKDTVKTMITLQITLVSIQYVEKKKHLFFKK